VITAILNLGFGSEYQKVYEDCGVVPIFCLHMIIFPPGEGSTTFITQLKHPINREELSTFGLQRIESSSFLAINQVTVVSINLRSLKKKKAKC